MSPNPGATGTQAALARLRLVQQALIIGLSGADPCGTGRLAHTAIRRDVTVDLDVWSTRIMMIESSDSESESRALAA